MSRKIMVLGTSLSIGVDRAKDLLMFFKKRKDFLEERSEGWIIEFGTNKSTETKRQKFPPARTTFH